MPNVNTYFKESLKNYDYILENRCIYCGLFAKEGEMFALDSEGDKLCPKHEEWCRGERKKKIINNLEENL